MMERHRDDRRVVIPAKARNQSLQKEWIPRSSRGMTKGDEFRIKCGMTKRMDSQSNWE